MTETLETLSEEECFALLATSNFGRIAVIVDDYPVVLPVNYRLAEFDDESWIALRPRPGNVIARATKIGFEVDGADPVRRCGWSVTIRGTLHHVDVSFEELRDRLDPHPWLVEERDAWLVIEPLLVTGRRLLAPPLEWAFLPQGYL